MSAFKNPFKSKSKELYTCKRALLIGINYVGTPNALNGCINDVANVKKVLIDIYGFSESSILVLTDETIYKPTQANILEGINWLLSSEKNTKFNQAKYAANKSPTAYYFHYSGHGALIADTNGDEPSGKDSVICPLDLKFITDDSLRELLVNKIDTSSRLTAVIDACHSGTCLDLLWNCQKTGQGFSLIKSGTYAATSGHVILLSGCMDTQTSADVGKIGGALTISYMDTLRNCGYKITYDGLLTSIREYMIKNHFSQIPMLSFGKIVTLSEEFTM